MTDNNDLSLLAGAYALGALSADDARRYERYLASREEARTEATQLEDTAALLGLASTEVQPSAALKSNLMALIAVTPQLPALEAHGADEDAASPRHASTAPARPTLHAVGDATPASPASTATPAKVPAARTATAPTVDGAPVGSVPASKPGAAETKAQARWFQKPVAFLAGAAAVVAVFLGASSLTGALNNGNQVQQALALASINAQSDVQRSSVPLLANDDGGEASTATLVWSNSLGESVLLVDGLEQLPADKVYELWYIDGENAPVSAGLFDIPSSGHTWSVLDGEMTAGATVGVTVEPAGGSKQPTSDPVIAIPTA